ncbi:MAG: hypothetical protein KDJ14_15510 [Xanthomonadales bacterium]|nr:hypothetical protein [Xanthomonadales bacterium]
MTEQGQREQVGRSSLYAELKRRNVFRVGAAYVVIGWLGLQVADVVLGFTGAPEWFGKTLIALLLLGFIPALALAWVFEVGPNGVHLDDGHGDSTTHASRLDTLTLVAVFFVVALMAWQHLGPAWRAERSAEEGQSSQATPAPAAASSKASPSMPQDGRIDTEPLQAPPGSIAVLPFTNRSAEPDTAYFVDGVHDDLLTELARNPTLTVISRTSVLEYRDTTKNLRQIGEELGVANVMEGAVQRAGQRVRINAQLIDARTDKHLWAETFDRELKPESVFEIQSEIASAIATALGQTLTSSADPVSVSALPTRNAQAYDLYLRARATREDTTERAIGPRLALYQRAVQADPSFALAMGEMAREHLNMFWYYSRRDEDREAGRQWIEKALALQPGDPQLRLAMAEYHYRAHLDYDQALAELAVAERGLPGSAEVAGLRAFIMRRAGRPDETMAALEQAVKLNPRSLSVLQTLTETSAMLGDLEASERWNARLEQLPGLPLGYGTLALLVYRSQHDGDASALRAEYERLHAALEADWDGAIAAQGLLGYLIGGDTDAFEREIDRLPDQILEDQFALHPKSLLRAQVAFLRQQPEQLRSHAEAAVREAEAIIAAHPDDYRAWMLKAHALAMLGQGDAARRAAERALATEIATRDLVLRSELQVVTMQVSGLLGEVEPLAESLERYLALPMKYWRFDGLMRLPELRQHRAHPAIQALAHRYASDGGRP